MSHRFLQEISGEHLPSLPPLLPGLSRWLAFMHENAAGASARILTLCTTTSAISLLASFRAAGRLEWHLLKTYSGVDFQLDANIIAFVLFCPGIHITAAPSFFRYLKDLIPQVVLLLRTTSTVKAENHAAAALHLLKCSPAGNAYTDSELRHFASTAFPHYSPFIGLTLLIHLCQWLTTESQFTPTKTLHCLQQIYNQAFLNAFILTNNVYTATLSARRYLRHQLADQNYSDLLSADLVHLQNAFPRPQPTTFREY